MLQQNKGQSQSIANRAIKSRLNIFINLCVCVAVMSVGTTKKKISAPIKFPIQHLPKRKDDQAHMIRRGNTIKPFYYSRCSLLTLFFPSYCCCCVSVLLYLLQRIVCYESHVKSVSVFVSESRKETL